MPCEFGYSSLSSHYGRWSNHIMIMIMISYESDKVYYRKMEERHENMTLTLVLGVGVGVGMRLVKAALVYVCSKAA